MKKGNIVTVKSFVHSGYPAPYIDGDMFAAGESEIYSTAKAIHVPQGGENQKDSRCLWRVELPEPVKCLVVGWSTRKTGFYYAASGDISTICSDYDSYEPAHLREDKTHRVWMCQPLTTNQWNKPLACMADDFVERRK